MRATTLRHQTITIRLTILISLVVTLIGSSPSIATSAATNCLFSDIGNWTSTSYMNSTRYRAEAVLANGYIYAVGGQDASNFRNSVEVAFINPDGSLSAWQSVAPMTNARTSLGVVATQGHLYAVGGWDGGPLSTVETAVINADGSLGPWILTTPLDSPVYDEGITQFNGYIYASHSDSIHRTKINPDGTLEPWITDPSHMAVSRDMPILLVANDWLYAIGGDATLKSTERAKINADGSLGLWSMTTSLNVARRDLSASIIDNYIYALGGWDSTTAWTTIEKAYINTDGSLGPWAFSSSTLTSPRVAASIVTTDNYAYMIGGGYNEWFTGAFNSVEVAPILRNSDCSSITGHITDSGGYPLAGVTISTGAVGSVITNDNGDYVFSGLEPGSYTLTPSLSGYTFSPSLSQPITVPPNAKQDFTAICNFGISWDMSNANNVIIPSKSPNCGQDVIITAKNPNPYWMNFSVTRVGKGLTFTPASAEDAKYNALGALPGGKSISYNVHFAQKGQHLTILFSSLNLNGNNTAQYLNMTDAIFNLFSIVRAGDPNDPNSCALVPISVDSASNVVAFYKNHSHLRNATNNIFKWPPDLYKAASEISKAWPNEFMIFGDQLATGGSDCFKNVLLYIIGTPAKVVQLFAEIPQWLAKDVYLYFQAPSGFIDYYSY